MWWAVVIPSKVATTLPLGAATTAVHLTGDSPTHYYQRNIGDYARDTGHLTVIEHGLYVLMLDWYYLNERPITDREVTRLSRGFRDDALTVLCEFFKETEDGWVHSYADREIAKYHAKAEKNRANGQSGGRPRASGNPEETQSVPIRIPDVTLTNNHKPITKRSRATVQPTAARFPDFWDAYPNKKGKQEAEKRWRKDKLDERADEIIAHVKTMTAKDDGWQRGYVPMGSTYLNQARWTDVPKSAPLPLNGQKVEPKVSYKTAAETLIPTESREDNDAAWRAQQRALGLMP